MGYCCTRDEKHHKFVIYPPNKTKAIHISTTTRGFRYCQNSKPSKYCEYNNGSIFHLICDIWGKIDEKFKKWLVLLYVEIGQVYYNLEISEE